MATATLNESELLTFLFSKAGGWCQCSGECGRTHRAGWFRDGSCEVWDLRRLTATPADVSVPMSTAATLPADELKLRCHDCYDGAISAVREVARMALQADQPELWGAP